MTALGNATLSCSSNFLNSPSRIQSRKHFFTSWLLLFSCATFWLQLVGCLGDVLIVQHQKPPIWGKNIRYGWKWRANLWSKRWTADDFISSTRFRTHTKVIGTRFLIHRFEALAKSSPLLWCGLKYCEKVSPCRALSHLRNLIFNRMKFSNVYAKVFFFFQSSTQPTPHQFFPTFFTELNFHCEKPFSSLIIRSNRLKIYVAERVSE